MQVICITKNILLYKVEQTQSSCCALCVTFILEDPNKAFRYIIPDATLAIRGSWQIFTGGYVSGNIERESLW